MRSEFTRFPARARRASLADAQASCAPVCQTRHARLRAAQRNLSAADEAYILTWGREFHRTGAVFYCLAEKDIPAQHRHLPAIMRLVGAVVLASREEEIITLYRHARTLRAIQRKMKYRLVPGPNLICADVEEEDEALDDEPGDAGEV
jgi:hypothetical protein